MAFPDCGAKRGHLGGCPRGPKPEKNRRGEKPSKGHVHNYVTVRQNLIKDGPMKGKTIYFMECLNAGCPKPDKMEIR